jgi:hypothetical protein
MAHLKTHFSEIVFNITTYCAHRFPIYPLHLGFPNNYLDTCLFSPVYATGPAKFILLY